MLAFGSLFYSTKSIVLLLKILGGIEIDYIYTQPTDFAVLIHVHTKVIYPKYVCTTNTEKEFSIQSHQGR